MSLKQTVYFMALVGAMAGLGCWALQSWISDFHIGLNQAQFTVLVTAIMGALIGGFTVGFADHWTADRIVARWVAAGVVLGALAGTLGGLLYWPILSMMEANPGGGSALLGRPLTWLIAGGL